MDHFADRAHRDRRALRVRPKPFLKLYCKLTKHHWKPVWGGRNFRTCDRCGESGWVV